VKGRGSGHLGIQLLEHLEAEERFWDQFQWMN